MVFLGMELDNNINIKSLINVIANELKSSYLLDFDSEEETKLLVNGENNFLPEDLKKIIRSIVK